MKMGRRPAGVQSKEAWSEPRVYKYQHTVIAKICIECGKAFQAIRRLKPICSDECKGARRSRFRPQTFLECSSCGNRFGPASHLKQRLCSRACKVKKQSTGRKVTRKTIPKAINAQRLVRYHVQAGHIIRPNTCEQCGVVAKIEGAHFNYDEPLRVRWLCRSCHVRWDKAEPKHGTIRIYI